MPGFSVDTHLFRELGEYLVGRDSTALLELVKNAYDADATEVVVIGSELDNPERGSVVVSDNGCGMDERQFQEGFLRIAARTKETGTRRSRYFQRRYTGAKGIGRLAAHKLARHLSVHSVPGAPGTPSTLRLVASIDWDAIEAKQSLDELTNEVTVDTENLPIPRPSGTHITLQRLRRGWTSEERVQFVSECGSILPAELLTTDLSNGILAEPLLFARPLQRQTSDKDKGFSIRLEGDFETGDPFWQIIAQTANWVIEIDALRTQPGTEPVIRYGVAPTNARLHEQPGLHPRVFESPRRLITRHVNPNVGPYFQARILVQVNPKDIPTERERVRRESGVRVYVEGFRVLPYGEPDNDWLGIDANYNRRSALEFGTRASELFGPAEADPNWTETLLPNRSYFGAVFLAQDNTGDLRQLINREGFLPNYAYLMLRNSVRLGIDLFTRVRAAAEFEGRSRKREARRQRQQQNADSNVASQPSSNDEEPNAPATPARQEIAEALADAQSAVQAARISLSTNNLTDARKEIEILPTRLHALQQAAERITEEVPFFRVLSSIGTQMSTFVHEIRGLIGTTQIVYDALDRIRRDASLRRETRAQLSAIFANVSDLKRSLERQASYLLDIATPDASRRRSRQSLAERFDAGVRLLQAAAERRRIEIVNDIPPDVKSPPMFPAELTTVFSNLLSNAVKAAGTDGRIRAQVKKTQQGVVVTVENTGVAVNLDEAERWFQPFESTTTQVESPLWQGMGLGLTITRNALEEYGAAIRFVPPSPGFATAIEIMFPE